MKTTFAAQTVLAVSLIHTALAHGVHRLVPRGANCGPSYGGAVCDAGLCCSSAGVCGTGSACVAPDCLFQYGPACDANQTPPGVNTSSIARPQFGNLPYGATITKCNTPGKVALTFDDGPWLYTSDLLDLLKGQNIKATFFVVANNGGKGQIENDSTGYPALLRRMLSEGHQIASHTWSHQDLSTLNAQQIQDQVIKNEIAFEDIFGFIPTYMRPPYGRCSGDCLSILGNLGYHVITWNLDTNDWQENYPASQATFTNAIQNSNPATDSFIPLTHDIHYGTVHGFAQFMIDHLKAAGYTTALVGECLNDPPVNWYRDAKSGQPWGGNVATSTSASPPPTTTSTSTSTSTSTTSSTSTSTSTSSSSSTSTSTSTSSTSSSTSSNSFSSSTTSTTSSSSTTHGKSASTHESMHATVTLSPSYMHLNATLSNDTAPHSSITTGGCTNNVGACVLQGLGASTIASPTTAPTSTSPSSTAAPKTGAAMSSFEFGGLAVLILTVLSAIVLT